MSSTDGPALPGGFQRERAMDTAVLDERRSTDRHARDLLVTLVRDDGSQIGPYPTDNLSEHGMHVTLPVGYGLAVGQRYELILQEGREPSAGRGEEGLYATVVRTQMRSGPDRNAIGVGLRLDQPLFL